jgi:2-polyprenyl-3-methyl-5-hydroxy-6-metoxy-1,4-benzoquinol methylase
MEDQKKDQTADEIMQRIRASLGRHSPTTRPSARESPCTAHTTSIPMEKIDFGNINERTKAAENRSLVCNISPGMNRYPAVIRPFARLVGKVILFFGQLITKPQESYNVAAVQVMNALKDSIRVLAERQVVLVKELAALNQKVEELSRLNQKAPENLANNEEKHRNLVAELARIEELVTENVTPSMDDALYIAFEHQFRGTRQEIKDRARVYLPAVTRALGATKGGTVLDLGCGRGEWLELLREQNISASGVDSSRAMVDECRSYSLSAERADVMEYLKAQQRDALAAVTGFHIIEHLPLSVWIRLLDETLRILKPGGVAIFETPNPENVLVGSNTFYFDPTHRNPLPSAVVQFITRERGFDPVEIVPLHPADPENFLTETTPIANKFNYYFYGPRDYAIVAWKKSL